MGGPRGGGASLCTLRAGARGSDCTVGRAVRCRVTTQQQCNALLCGGSEPALHVSVLFGWLFSTICSLENPFGATRSLSGLITALQHLAHLREAFPAALGSWYSLRIDFSRGRGRGRHRPLQGKLPMGAATKKHSMLEESESQYFPGKTKMKNENQHPANKRLKFLRTASRLSALLFLPYVLPLALSPYLLQYVPYFALPVPDVRIRSKRSFPPPSAPQPV